MKRTSVLLSLYITFIIVLVGCTTGESANNQLGIAVSIQPEAAFVEAVIGDKGTVTTVIPPGFSPANYQPTPKELAKISDADLYFSIGVPAEKNILPKVVNHETKVISLMEAVEKDYALLHLEKHSHGDEHEEGSSHEDEHEETSGHEDEHEESSNHEDEHEEHAEHEEGFDPHIWMSPKRVKVMIETIRDELTTIDPDNADYYQANADNYIQELDNLDAYIKKTLSNSELESFIIYHPSLGYFADDYGLTMVVIEEDGKAAASQTIAKVIDFAKDNNIEVIFYQEEFDSKQAKVIADEINGRVSALDILSKDYINNTKKIIDTFVTTH